MLIIILMSYICWVCVKLDAITDTLDSENVFDRHYFYGDNVMSFRHDDGETLTISLLVV